MNETSKLIWPSSKGIGLVDEGDWNRTVELSQSTKNQDGKTVLTKKPEGQAYTNEYIQKAIDKAKAAGVDVTGSGFTPKQVTLNAGGA
jgi:NitT/TauT family transport system substrate-binding protein